MTFRRLLTAAAASARPRGVERDHVALALGDGRQVAVLRVRDPRARRIRLTVDERGARLTLPWRASLVSGMRFLEQHRDWLAVELAKVERHVRALPQLRPGVDGALPLRGTHWPLRWREARSRQLLLEDAALVFQVLPRDLASPAGATARAADAPDATAAALPTPLRQALRDFYLAEARADVGRWLPRYLPDLPRPPLRIGFKCMRSQWGSLSARGVMALDLSLVLAPPAAFEYVLVHELCHLIHHDHSAAFWGEVEARCPQWREQRDWFKAEGRALKASLQVLLAG
ncbi:MAG: SprT family zinc-dependent metalloprotease [Pseudoxanthomonas suwonensis]|nr:SprT family zinc-dependent metalloprotease [Pseudoxanthomonas suwonensis]